MKQVMNQEEQRTYVFERKLHPDAEQRKVQIETLNSIVIYNGYRSEEVAKLLSDKTTIPYTAKESTEQYFYEPQGILHIVNARGMIRYMRDVQQAEVLAKELQKPLNITTKQYHEDKAEASHRFERFAFDTVKEAFNHIDKKEMDRRKKLTLIFGPHTSFPLSEDEIITEKNNDYLNFKATRLRNNTTIIFDYVFGDQAMNIVNQWCVRLNALFENIDLDIFHYGKVGLLKQESSIGDVCLPNGTIDEDKIQLPEKKIVPIYNQLTLDKDVEKQFMQSLNTTTHQGVSVNTASVLQQTVETLEEAKKVGGQFIEMEWAGMTSLDVGSNSRYPNLGTIHYHLAGIGSDKPLQGITLATTTYPKNIEEKVARAFKEIIQR